MPTAPPREAPQLLRRRPERRRATARGRRERARDRGLGVASTAAASSSRRGGSTPAASPARGTRSISRRVGRDAADPQVVVCPGRSGDRAVEPLRRLQLARPAPRSERRRSTGEHRRPIDRRAQRRGPRPCLGQRRDPDDGLAALRRQGRRQRRSVRPRAATPATSTAPAATTSSWTGSKAMDGWPASAGPLAGDRAVLPDNSFRVGKVRLDRKRGTAILAVEPARSRAGVPRRRGAAAASGRGRGQGGAAGPAQSEGARNTRTPWHRAGEADSHLHTQRWFAEQPQLRPAAEEGAALRSLRSRALPRRRGRSWSQPRNRRAPPARSRPRGRPDRGAPVRRGRGRESPSARRTRPPAGTRRAGLRGGRRTRLRSGPVGGRRRRRRGGSPPRAARARRPLRCRRGPAG